MQAAMQTAPLISRHGHGHGRGHDHSSAIDSGKRSNGSTHLHGSIRLRSSLRSSGRSSGDMPLAPYHPPRPQPSGSPLTPDTPSGIGSGSGTGSGGGALSSKPSPSPSHTLFRHPSLRKSSTMASPLFSQSPPADDPRPERRHSRRVAVAADTATATVTATGVGAGAGDAFDAAATVPLAAATTANSAANSGNTGTGTGSDIRAGIGDVRRRASRRSLAIKDIRRQRQLLLQQNSSCAADAEAGRTNARGW